jgi:hypothetical protein
MASHASARSVFVALLTGAALLGSAAAAESDLAQKKDAAAAAATEWLSLVDEGKYAESWAAAAELFQNAVPKGQWAEQLEGARKPLGKVTRRELRSRAFKPSMPGAPDGQYVVIQYVTSFSNKKLALETVTPMLERDGKWRVSGYYVK